MDTIDVMSDSSHLRSKYNATAQYCEQYLAIFLWTGFMATVCASTGDNWYDRAHTKLG